MLLALMLVVRIVVWPIETFLEEEAKAFVELIILLDRLEVQIPLLKRLEKRGLSSDDVLHGDVSRHFRTKHRLLGDRWNFNHNFLDRIVLLPWYKRIL